MGGANLSRFNQDLRDYQREVLSHASEVRTEGGRACYALPTGSGKGSIIIEALRQWPEAWCITPSLDVIRGFVERCGGEASTEAELIENARPLRVTTPVRLANEIRRGDSVPPETLIIDEAHHATDQSDVMRMLTAPARAVLGFTATPFRGSPKQTAYLHEFWHQIFLALSFRDAVSREVIAQAKFVTVPLIDDGVLSGSGEFNIDESDVLAELAIAGLTDCVNQYANRPTLVAVPGRRAAGALVQALRGRGVHISATTPASERTAAYTACREGRVVLVVIGVAVEGIDLPWLRVLIDARPTKSPVRWLQTLGRILRPGPDQPLYVGLTHNLERHAYVLEGTVAPAEITEAQTVWGPEPGLRALTGRLGLETVGRFQPIPLPLASGGTAAGYLVWSHSEDGAVKQQALIVSPYYEAFGAARVRREWPPPPWAAAPVTSIKGWRAPQDRNQSATEKQALWWRRSAIAFGLNSAIHPTRGQFELMMVCNNLRKRLA